MLLCNCCFHPVLKGMNCPFCGTTDTTERCGTCDSVMLAMPTDLNEDKVQLICQACALEGRPQPVKQP